MDQIGNLLDRPRLYYNIDGVGELYAGLVLLGFTLLIWLQAHSPENAVWHRLYIVVVYGAVMLAVIWYGRKWVKERITYPRTGFVEYRRIDRRRPSIIAAVLGALLPLGLVAANRRQWDITTPASLTGLIFGLVFAAVYAYGFIRTAPWKWAVVLAMTLTSLVIAFPGSAAVGTLADNVVTTVLPRKTEVALLLTVMLLGVILLVSGGISLWLYLRHTQAPAEEGQ